MCQFFSFVTDPINHPAEYYYFDWDYRKSHLEEGGADSHSHICSHFKLNEDRCNKYEFNPLTKMFTVDQINSERDDSEAAEKWANRLNFKEIVEPLIVKPNVNPLILPKVEKPTDEQIGWLKVWDSVRDSVGASVWTSVAESVWTSVGESVWISVGESVGESVWTSVWASVWDSVWDSVRDSVRDSVWTSIRDSIRDSVRDSVWDSVGAYASAFFAVDYKYDYSSVAKLWEAGLVPSFDGTTWRLHSGEKAEVVYEWIPEVQE